jgi:hypothetical protein
MIDALTERIAPMVPFMTGAFKDAALAKNPLFSAETALAEYAAANAAKPPPAAVLPSQVIAAAPVISPVVATVTAPAPAVVADPPFAPVFRKATGTDGVITWSLNSTYFATKETAQWIANKFGIGEVSEVPFGGNGGIFASDANEFHIKLKDGRLVNAGLLAGYYERNPPEKFPGLAEKLIRSQLGLV